MKISGGREFLTRVPLWENLDLPMKVPTLYFVISSPFLLTDKKIIFNYLVYLSGRLDKS